MSDDPVGRSGRQRGAVSIGEHAEAVRPRGRRATLIIAVVLVLAIVGASTARIVHAVGILRDARDDLTAATDAITSGELARADELLADAESGLADVTATLHTAPEVTALGLVPVLKENISVLRQSLHLASVLVHGGRQILDAAMPLQRDDGQLELSIEEANIDVDLVTALQREVDALLVELRVTLRDHDSGLLLGEVRSLAESVQTEAESRLRDLDRARRGMVILDRLLGVSEPSRTLIVVSNSAEMRGTGGMMLNYGVLRGSEGAATIERFGRVEELAIDSPPTPQDVGLPDDFVRRWAGFDFTREWRNATLSADFREMAPVLAAMFQRATGLPAHNVLQVDPVALSGLLSVTGPIQIEEVGEVNADNVVDLVLNEAYRRFPDVEQRTDVLGEVAETTFRSLVEGNIQSARSLADALVTAADGRHLLFYSQDGFGQSAAEYFDVDGSLPDPDSEYLHLTAQNMGGNKLDYYVDTSLRVEGRRPPGSPGELTATITVANNAPVGVTEPRYIFGPLEEDETDAGVYRGAITLYLPTGTQLVEAAGDGFRNEPVALTEHGRPVVGYWIDVPAGQEHVVELTFTVAPTSASEDYSMTLVPSPRVRPTTVSLDIDVGDDGRVVEDDLVLDTSWVVTEAGAEAQSGF